MAPFRPAVLRRNAGAQQRPALPRLPATRTPVLLWLVAGLSAALGGLAWSTRIPAYATGLAVVAPGEGDTLQLVVLLPAEELAHLEVGQALLLEAGRSTTIEVVEGDILGPVAAAERFGLRLDVLTGPAAIVRAPFEPPSADATAQAWVGSTRPVRVQVGSRSLLSRLRFFGGPS